MQPPSTGLSEVLKHTASVLRSFICQAGALVLLAVAISSPGWAQTRVLTLSDDDEGTAVFGYLYFLEDKDSSLDIADFTDPEINQRFELSQDKVPSFGLSRSALWFRLSLANGNDRPAAWWLELQEPILDQIDVYIKRQNGTLELKKMGDNRPFSARDIKIRNPLAALNMSANEKLDVYIRIRTHGLLSVPIHIWKPEAYPPEAINTQIKYGIYYGIILALLLYNLIIYFSIKYIAYLYYCVFVFCNAAYQFAINGLGYEYLWQKSGHINLTIAMLTSNISLFFAVLFTRTFLDIPRLFPRINTLTLCVLSITPLPLLIFFAADKGIGIKVNATFSAMLTLMTILLGIYTLSRGVKQAKYFVIAWLALVLGIWTYDLTLVGWLPANFYTIHARQIGSAIELILLASALAHRMRVLMQESERLEREAKEGLQDKVIQRTQELDNAMAELAEANRTLRDISYNDGLTGVKNRLYFDEYYQREWRRSFRTNSSLALIMLDIDRFKIINDRYGHLCGDKALQITAELISNTLKRPGDLVARYGGEEFIIVLPNTDARGAEYLAEAIRKKLENNVFTFKDHYINFTASIGYSAGAPSSSDISPEGLIQSADKALYAAKNQGRNCVVAA